MPKKRKAKSAAATSKSSATGKMWNSKKKKKSSGGVLDDSLFLELVDPAGEEGEEGKISMEGVLLLLFLQVFFTCTVSHRSFIVLYVSQKYP